MSCCLNTAPSICLAFQASEDILADVPIGTVRATDADMPATIVYMSDSQVFLSHPLTGVITKGDGVELDFETQ